MYRLEDITRKFAQKIHDEANKTTQMTFFGHDVSDKDFRDHYDYRVNEIINKVIEGNIKW